MKTVSREEVINFLRKQLEDGNGLVISALIVKADNGERWLNCRLGVHKGVKGTGMSYNPLDKGLLPVYDLQKAQQMSEEERESKPPFRMINMNTVKELKAAGQHLVVAK